MFVPQFEPESSVIDKYGCTSISQTPNENNNKGLLYNTFDTVCVVNQREPIVDQYFSLPEFKPVSHVIL